MSKVARLSFSVRGDVTLGAPRSFTISGAPSRNLFIDTVLTNAPERGFAEVACGALDIQGDGYGVRHTPGGPPVFLLAGKLITVEASYSGAVPAGFTRGASFNLVFTMIGPER
jgi:hypothetical protein